MRLRFSNDSGYDVDLEPTSSMIFALNTTLTSGSVDVRVKCVQTHTTQTSRDTLSISLLQYTANHDYYMSQHHVICDGVMSDPIAVPTD